MKTILISVLLIMTIPSYGQKVYTFEPFVISDYPKEDYLITTDTFRFGNLLIEFRMIRNNSGYNPFSCRAWLTIYKTGNPIYQKYIKDIFAVGACYGLFFPSSQPRKDYFILTKLGDYDGNIFIIDSLGNVTIKIGGEFYISKDNRYLFSNYASDDSGLTIYDFKEGKVLFSSTLGNYISEWYFQDNKYITNSGIPYSKDTTIYYSFDLTANKLVTFRSDPNYLKKANKLNIYNERNSMRDCNCGLERLPDSLQWKIINRQH